MRRVITFEEKIDYIYWNLRAQKRAKILRFLIILSAIWWLIVISNWTDKQDVIDSATKVLSNIVQPITQRVIDDMVNSNTINTQWLQEWLMHKIEQDPTILDNFKNNDN